MKRLENLSNLSLTERSYPSSEVIKEAIDLTINQPKVINRANAIKARYDAGIVNFRQDGTGVIETVIMKNMGNIDGIPEGKTTDVACTLLARDWKGVNNYSFNGVVECQK